MPSLWSQSTQGQSHVVSAMSYTGSWQRDQMWQKVSLLGNPDTLTKRLLKWNHLPNVGRGPVVADKEVFEVALVVRSRGGRLCLRYHDDDFDYDWANDGNDDDCDDCDVDDIDDDCDDTHGKPPILELRPSAPNVGCVLEMVICIVVCVQSDQLMYCMSVHLSFWSFQTKTSWSCLLCAIILTPAADMTVVCFLVCIQWIVCLVVCIPCRLFTCQTSWV